MSHLSAGAAVLDPADLRGYAEALEEWLGDHAALVTAASQPTTDTDTRVKQMVALMGELFDSGWSRYGWPEAVGGLGGSGLHRAVMWDALARHGVPGLFPAEHLEVLGPTLVALGPPALVGELFPRFLQGSQLWAQGFSEPDAGSDLASLRTRATPVDGGYVINGRKIWTSWARFAKWALVLARTGTIESRHRGITAFVVDLDAPGVEVRSILQANGNDELAEVAFDNVVVADTAIIGALDGGWSVAMHILGNERATFAWFRHVFLYQALLEATGGEDPGGDEALGDAVLDLLAVTALSHRALAQQDAGQTLGPSAAFTKLSLCQAERAVYDRILAERPLVALDAESAHLGSVRQEYLFSRIVTVYGGSQQMQLLTIAKQLLGLA